MPVDQEATIDHRSALVRLLRHENISQDAFDSAMFHFDQAVATQDQANDREDLSEETLS